MQFYNKNITLPEIFDKVKEEDTVAGKVEVLRKYDTKQMRWFVDAMYNGEFWCLDIPEYKPNSAERGLAISSIQHSISRLNNCLKYRDKKELVEKNLALVLESVTSREALLLEALINGDKKVEGVNKSVFKKAYPQFFRGSNKLL